MYRRCSTSHWYTPTNVVSLGSGGRSSKDLGGFLKVNLRSLGTDAATLSTLEPRSARTFSRRAVADGSCLKLPDGYECRVPQRMKSMRRPNSTYIRG